MLHLKKITCLMSIVLMFLWITVAGAAEILIGYTGPLSGAGAEYGQDCFNGADMAVRDMNAAGGITVKGKKYTIKLVKLDDRNDPTQGVNNARRLRSQGAVGIISPIFNTIAPLMKINEEPGQEFLVLSKTSTPKVSQIKNKLTVSLPVPFTVYAQILADHVWAQGSRKLGMMVTLGAYGDEWRTEFSQYWKKIGGTITADKPANYYTETDFSSQLTYVLSTKPDVMLIGGPSAPTALVVEQARGMGYKGGLILIDQAKMDYIANVLKGLSLLENTIGIAPISNMPLPGIPAFHKRYSSRFARLMVLDVFEVYMLTTSFAKAIEAAGTVDDRYAIRAAYSKVFPLLGNEYPVETFGISSKGLIYWPASVQTIKNGKYDTFSRYVWWAKNQKEFDKVKKLSKKPASLKWLKIKIDNVE